MQTGKAVTLIKPLTNLSANVSITQKKILLLNDALTFNSSVQCNAHHTVINENVCTKSTTGFS